MGEFQKRWKWLWETEECDHPDSVMEDIIGTLEEAKKELLEKNPKLKEAMMFRKNYASEHGRMYEISDDAEPWIVLAMVFAHWFGDGAEK